MYLCDARDRVAVEARVELQPSCQRLFPVIPGSNTLCATRKSELAHRGMVQASLVALAKAASRLARLRKAPITLSEKAADRIRDLLSKRDKVRPVYRAAKKVAGKLEQL